MPSFPFLNLSTMSGHRALFSMLMLDGIIKSYRSIISLFSMIVEFLVQVSMSFVELEYGNFYRCASGLLDIPWCAFVCTAVLT